MSETTDEEGVPPEGDSDVSLEADLSSEEAEEALLAGDFKVLGKGDR